MHLFNKAFAQAEEIIEAFRQLYFRLIREYDYRDPALLECRHGLTVGKILAKKLQGCQRQEDGTICTEELKPLLIDSHWVPPVKGEAYCSINGPMAAARGCVEIYHKYGISPMVAQPTSEMIHTRS